jgi:hypothetical protein
MLAGRFFWLWLLEELQDARDNMGRQDEFSSNSLIGHTPTTVSILESK